MKLLTRLGKILLTTTQIVMGIAPILPQYQKETGKVIDTLEQLSGIIVFAEAFGQTMNLAGPDKLKAATPMIAQAILQSSILADRKIANPELFHAGAQKIADGMADILNSLNDDVESKEKA